ncbi:MAG: thiamine-phosphate kinase [Phycisphaerales bacterium]
MLDHIRERSSHLRGRGAVVVGPGDDCAVLALPGLTLATVDHLVEGRHYGPSTPIDLIARKAVARSVSDIAAMGGEPSCGLATGCLRADFERADELFDRMAHWGEEFGCPLAGGDIATTKPASEGGVNVLTVTVLGSSHVVRGPVERRTAREGDLVCVTGAFGGSLESGRHLTFEPRVREGRELCDLLGRRLTAMIDVSDGLGRDAGRIAKASGVRIEMDSWKVPLARGVKEWRRGVGDGEDYELLFAIEPGMVPRSVGGGTAVTVIGRVVRGTGCVVLDESGVTHDASQMGWDHGVNPTNAEATS